VSAPVAYEAERVEHCLHDVARECGKRVDHHEVLGGDRTIVAPSVKPQPPERGLHIESVDRVREAWVVWD
jgi:hypothetical protein